MISSMTGFARIEEENTLGHIVMEMKTVNHRYLEMGLRIPEELRAHEAMMREIVHKKFMRGKVEINIRFKPNRQSDLLQIDEQHTKTLLATLEEVEQWMNNPARMTAIEVLNWPGVIKENALDQGEMSQIVTDLINRAIEQVHEMRNGEGERLAEFIEARLKQVSEIIVQIRQRLPEVQAAIRAKMLTRIEELVEVDQQRLEQELALIAQKLDIDEELDRLTSHIQAVGDAMKKKTAVGRRLDFLMQEFNREANTIASKSADAQTTQAAVELKVIIEQMREQIQNIE